MQIDVETKTMSKEALRSSLQAVYTRVADGTLSAADIVTTRDLNVQSPVSWVKHVIDNRLQLQEDAVLFRAFTPDMGTILDVGAHWGYSALSFRFAGCDCPTVSFEILSAHRACLEAVKAFDPRRHDFLNDGLSDKDGTLRFLGPVINGEAVTGLNSAETGVFADWNIDYVVSLHGSIIKDAPRYDVKILSEESRVHQLDTLLTHHRFAVPTERFVAFKLDILGHEAHALRGARGVLERDRPLLMIEGGNRLEVVPDLLDAAGYAYGERVGDCIVPTSATSGNINGFYFHRDRSAEYRRLGILAS
jgi:FkbM family methyltransferase